MTEPGIKAGGVGERVFFSPANQYLIGTMTAAPCTGGKRLLTID